MDKSSVVGGIMKVWRHQDRDVVLSIIGVKLALYVVSFLIFSLTGDAAGAVSVATFLSDVWNRWDGPHYISIAEHGYQTVGDPRNFIVFFPLYPVLIKLLSLITGSLVGAALIISNIASIAGLYLFYKLASLELGRAVAWRSLWVLMLFPTAYFFSAVYTESLFLMLVVGSFYAARRDKWLLAACLGGLATLTRLTGVLLLPALAVEFMYQHWRDFKRWSSAIWLVVIPGAFAVYLVINFKLYGNAFEFMDIQRDHWYKHFVWPWESLPSLGQYWHGLPLDSSMVLYGFGEVGAAALAVVGIVWAVWKLRPSYVVYLAATTFIILSNSFVMGTPRFLLGAFPVFFMLGYLGKHKILARVWLFVSTALLIAIMSRFNHGWWTY